jgi:prepilin-type N-terminal cleavage/methylation domain-containing protein
MRKNNKGFSYVEMLMVLAIMAIMIGLVTISVGLIGRTTVSRVCDKVESLCNKARTQALTKGSSQGYLNMVQLNGNVYAYVGEMVADDNAAYIREHGEKICSSDYEIITNVSGASTGVGTSDGQIHRIMFKQSTGGIGYGGIGHQAVIIVKKKNSNKTESFSIYSQTGKILDRKRTN